MEEPDIPWVYVAMVAIIFVRWLMGQFKKAAQMREARRQKMRRGWDDKPPEHSPVYKAREPAPPRQRPQVTTTQQAPQKPAKPQTLQELFEMRRKEIAEAQRRPVTPPPIPVKKEVEVQAPEVVTPFGSVKRQKKPIVPPTPQKKSEITKVFSDHDQIRRAFILKEVLDTPKSLQ